MPGLQSPQKKQKTVGTTPTQRNVNRVILGNRSIDPWFPSFYPKEQVGDLVETLCVCQWCFKYTPAIVKYQAHCKVCPYKIGPPIGREIYEKDKYSVYRIDGDEHKLYAQNLSLFAKLFLDTKSVFFDVSSFLYYTLVLHSDDGDQVIGFFSKEKMSWDNNNVACILVFPPWQRQGLGQVLMGISYELGRRENRFGGPEKPLSDSGRRAYISFWCGEISRLILSKNNKSSVSIADISQHTWIMAEDVVTALKEMDVTESRKTNAGSVVVQKSKVQIWAASHGVKDNSPIDVDALIPEDDEDDEEDYDDDE